MKFTEAKEILDRYGVISRRKWYSNMKVQKCLFFQIPTVIPYEVVEKMTSLPQGIKNILIEKRQNFRYINQLAELSSDNVIQSYCLSVEDINANDWIEVNSHIYNGELVPAVGKEFNSGK